MAMQMITGLRREMLVLSMLVEVVPSMLVEVAGGTEDKEGHSFLETCLVGHPLLEVGVLIGELIKVPSNQP